MSKIDGRRLRKDIKEYIALEHPGKDPHFTIRSVNDKMGHFSNDRYLDVRFDELDPDLEIWYDVAEWVNEKWWPLYGDEATMSVKIWRGRYMKYSNVEVSVNRIQVGYGFTH